MRFLWKALAAASMCFAAGAASATVIGFDDLPTSPSKWDPAWISGPLPSNYKGLVWTVAVSEENGPVLSGTGWFHNISGATTTSGKNFLASIEGTIGISTPDSSVFTFNGFWARSSMANNDSWGLDVLGVDKDFRYFHERILPTDTYQLYKLDWQNMTGVMFGFGGGVLVDDVEITQVPEPTTLALIAAGLFAVASARRMRR